MSRRHAGVPLKSTYVKRPSSAVCAGCNWHQVASDAESAGMRQLRADAGHHAATQRHRVLITLVQDVWLEPAAEADPATAGGELG